MVAKKYSTRVELADRILPDLLAATEKYGTPQAKQAAAVLAKWDRLNESNSRGAVLFYALARQFMGPSMAIQSGFATPYSLASPMTTPSGLKDPAKAAQQLDAAATETMHDFGSLDVPWGQVMRFQINNQSNGQTNNTRSPPQRCQPSRQRRLRQHRSLPRHHLRPPRSRHQNPHPHPRRRLRSRHRVLHPHPRQHVALLRQFLPTQLALPHQPTPPPRRQKDARSPPDPQSRRSQPKHQRNLLAHKSVFALFCRVAAHRHAERPRRNGSYP